MRNIQQQCTNINIFKYSYMEVNNIKYFKLFVRTILTVKKVRPKVLTHNIFSNVILRNQDKILKFNAHQLKSSGWHNQGLVLCGG